MKLISELFDLTKRYVKASRKARQAAKRRKLIVKKVRQMIREHQNAGKEVVNA